jgi:hypothetical protein
LANNLGDFDPTTVVYGKFVSVRVDTGAPATLTSGALSVYKDNSLTQSTTGVTFTGDFDSVTGLNHFAIDTSADGSFYSAGSFFDVVITTGTVNSISAVGYCVGQFTLRKTAALKPTTAARTLDVSATGEAGVDWANVGSPTTANALTATTISSSQVVASVTGAVGSVTAAGTLTASERNSVADALLDRTDAVETGLTPRSALKVALAATGGKVSGAATTTNTFRNAVADTKNRIIATVDSDGNRTAITYDLT